MINWFYNFKTSIETEAQEHDSVSKLMGYIEEVDKEGNVNPNLLSFTRKFVRESFVPILPLLCFRSYIDIYCGDVDENCFVESDNSSLKRDHMGPNANNKLVTSAHSINNHTKRRMGKLQITATKNFEMKKNPKPTDTVYDEYRIELSNTIVEYKCNQIVDQFEMSLGKIMHSLSAFKCSTIF